MRRGNLAAALGAVLVTGAAAWANVCPMCLQQIPDTDKYCVRHKAEQIAKVNSAAEEKKLMADLVQARKEYLARLDKLKTFYTDRGNAECLRRVQKEFADFAKVDLFSNVLWETQLPELSATQDSAEATKLLAEADELRGGGNPFTRSSRYGEAAAKYREILEKHPKSTATSSAAWGLGEILSSGSYKEYARALRFYDMCYLVNPATTHDALYRAAKVSDDELNDYETASRYYWLAARMGKSQFVRDHAAARLLALQKNGFGTTYSLEGKADPATAGNVEIPAPAPAPAKAPAPTPATTLAPAPAKAPAPAEKK
jgi:TolA-binding protein